ncbi:hypothetical protein J7T55_000442 [Diaporthe amygdali]|uniref:uncharacterized protein n=1 Tax=Phomopsis amygdali TaxID=1214568 RepID=UPI0022FDB50D|nr:uncharacterized protein J7T55_000442 [Diaporthe amygdali]KAJ0103815.1 hypothetical protein J7T55_000442 [Diaporthe amygdali]
MQFTSIFAIVSALASFAAADNPCCNYTNGGDCITNCGKRSLSSSTLARHILNVAEEVRSITSADADEIAAAIMKGHDLPVQKE